MDRSPDSLPAAAVAQPQAPRELARERDRMAERLTDVVVRRLFAAGLDLQAALGLVGNHPGADRIDHAIGELDQAITDIRDAIFDRAPATAATHPDGGHGPWMPFAADSRGLAMAGQHRLGWHASDGVLQPESSVN